jgi:hypothetical protein
LTLPSGKLNPNIRLRRIGSREKGKHNAGRRKTQLSPTPILSARKTKTQLSPTPMLSARKTKTQLSQMPILNVQLRKISYVQKLIQMPSKLSPNALQRRINSGNKQILHERSARARKTLL